MKRTTRTDRSSVIDSGEWLISRARSLATGANVHRVEQSIATYRMFGEIVRRRPSDRDAQRRFKAVEAVLRSLRRAAAHRL